MAKYKVVHLQTHLPSSGNAAFRLHTALLKGGVHSTMLSLSTDVGSSEQIAHLRRRAEAVSIVNSKLQNYLTKDSFEDFGMFSYPVLGNDISKHELVTEADVIYLHWAIGGFMTFKNMHQLAKLNKPIIVFMHDMWNMTGGCHYSFTCTNYKTDCSNCQMFPEGKKNGISIKGFKKKKKLYDSYDNLFFVAPSKWIYEMAKESALTNNKPIHYIPNLVGHEPFKPLNKKMAREILGLSTDDIIIAFGAASPTSPYKGWKYLKEALEKLAAKFNKGKVTVAIFGSDHDDEIAESIPFKTHFLGRLRDDYSTALVYNSADVFVAPSVAEAFGLVILEALRCGTPVAAFNTGGIPDIIEHQKNGYLANYRDAEDLARGIQFCIDQRLKGYAQPKFDEKSIIDGHIELFDQMLNLKSID